jgi:hypothetical protein
VKIIDIIGREYFNGEFALQKGTNQLSLYPDFKGMPPGIYHVSITGKNSKSILLLVE